MDGVGSRPASANRADMAGGARRSTSASAHDKRSPFMARPLHTDARMAHFGRRYTVVFNQTRSGSFYYIHDTNLRPAARVCPT